MCALLLHCIACSPRPPPHIILGAIIDRQGHEETK